jgi:hypothetical protein
MSLYGTGRFGHRCIAHLVIALAAVACHNDEANRPLDVAPIGAVPIDAPTDLAAAAVPPAPAATNRRRPQRN